MEKANKTLQLCKIAKETTKKLTGISDEKINLALCYMADALVESSDVILEANAEDIRLADGISSVMIDRLKLTKDRISGMANGIREITKLPSPLGRVIAND